MARGIPIERVVHWMAAAPARLAGLSNTKGAISVGADADLVIWDPDVTSVVDAARLHHRHPVSPYAGMTLAGRVKTTILRGTVIFNEGDVSGPPTGRMIGSSSS